MIIDSRKSQLKIRKVWTIKPTNRVRTDTKRQKLEAIRKKEAKS